MGGTAVARVLRDRVAGRYLAGVVVSGFGTSAMWLTAGIWVKSLTGSDSLAALTVCAMWAPVLAGPAIGALADRVGRKPLLVRVNLAMACLLSTLLLVDSGRTVWLVFAVLVLYGAGGVLLDAAESALVAGTVPAPLLADFNGLRMTANEGVKLVAPLVGAGLYTRFGGPAVALPAAATCVVAALVFARLPVREGPRVRGPERAESWRDELAAGLRRIRASAVLRPLVTAGAVTMLLAGVNGALTFAYVDDVLDRAPAYAGVLYAVQGAGSVAVQRETPDAVLGRTAATAGSLMTAPNAAALAAGAGLVAVVDVRVPTVAAGTLGVLAAAVLAAGVRTGRRPRGR